MQNIKNKLEQILNFISFDKWYFGHFHEDTEVEEIFFCLYDEMVEL